MNRVAEIYTHAVRRTEPPPSEALDLPALYRVEDDYRRGTRFERDRQYWMHRLTGIPRPSRLTEREFGVKQPSLSIRHVIDGRVVAALAASADRWNSAQVPISSRRSRPISHG